jgi:hypothetical protein
MDLKQIGLDNVDFIDLAQNRTSDCALVKSIEPFGSMQCREFLDFVRYYLLPRKLVVLFSP